MKDERRSASQEVDVWWGAYSARDMAPVFLLCVLLSVLIALLAWHYWEAAPPQVMWHVTLGLIVGIWLTVLLRTAYLITTLTYRLTTHHLFRDRGFREPADGVVELARVREVVVVQTVWRRRLDIGEVRVLPTDTASPLVLEGVCQPETVALTIRRHVQLARERTPAKSCR